MLRDPSEARISLKTKKSKIDNQKNQKNVRKIRINTIETSYKNNTNLFFENTNEVKNGFKPR